jgi:DNA polymerase-3 subunit delta'
VEEISRLGREKQKQFIKYFSHLLDQALRLRVMRDSAGEGRIAGTEKDFAERLNKIAGIEQQQAISEELDKASYYIERNANGKMLFHALTIKIYHIIKDNIVFLAD